MNGRRLSMVTATLGLVALLFLDDSARTQEAAAQADGVEVLARGPVHEAFALPGNTQPESGPVVTKPPPDSIEEVPPDQKPEGDNVQWISGYWAWDDDQGDYLWVSGCWRVPPPGRRWLPGHWQEIDKGWLWVAGFWAPATVEEVHYLPSPPPSLDKGPSAPAPNENSTYLPGCWVYRESRYFWRPGHWVAYTPNWIWLPARYVWTPSGCLFIDDYWDYPLDQRGLLFAPVRFDRRVWAAARRPYIPQYLVHHDFLIGALFVRRGTRHYYFGDYFEERYQKRGFVAWTDYRPSPGAFDPNFSYYRHQHAAEPRWEPGLRELYRARRSGEVPRPPRTLLQQVQVVKSITVNKTVNVNVHKNINLTHVQNVTALAPLKAIHNTRVTNLGALSQVKASKIPNRVLKIEPVPQAEHAREQKAAAQLREVAQRRRETEAQMLSKGGIPVKHTDPPRAVKLELPKPLPAVVAPRPVRQAPPAPVVLPRPEVRPIPKYTPAHPPAPPKRDPKR